MKYLNIFSDINGEHEISFVVLSEKPDDYKEHAIQVTQNIWGNLTQEEKEECIKDYGIIKTAGITGSAEMTYEDTIELLNVFGLEVYRIPIFEASKLSSSKVFNHIMEER